MMDLTFTGLTMTGLINAGFNIYIYWFNSDWFNK